MIPLFLLSFGCGSQIRNMLEKFYVDALFTLIHENPSSIFAGDGNINFSILV